MNTPPAGPINPYAPPRAEVWDVPDVAAGEPAGRLSRLRAYIIDLLIMSCVSAPALIPAMIQARRAHRGTLDLTYTDLLGPGGLISAVLLLLWGGSTIYLLQRNGQSIGKRLTGIKVVRKDGSRASVLRILLLRNLVNAIPEVIPVLLVVYPLIDTLMIFGDSRRCLHDRIADTLVIKA